MSLVDKDFLNHIFSETSYLVSAIEGKSFEELFNDETLKRAIVRSIEIIGEASKKISNELISNNPQIPWRDISNTRNILIHHYFGIDYDALWNILKNDIPELHFQIGKILNQ